MLLLILILLFALLIAIFAIQNAAPVAINLFWITTQIPLVLVIFGSVFAGALIVVLIAMWSKIRPKKKDKIIPQKPVKKKSLNTKENDATEQKQASDQK